MATKLTRLTHEMAIQLHLIADSCTICSSRARWPVRKLLDTLSQVYRYLQQNRSSNFMAIPVYLVNGVSQIKMILLPQDQSRHCFRKCLRDFRVKAN